MTNEKSEKKLVLIIDDDDNLRTVLLDKLSASGFNVEQATDGEDGLKKALAFHPDVILLDVMMPKMNGWDVLESLRKDDWGKSAKILLLTVLDDFNSVSRGLEKEANGYLVKTQLSLDEIVEQIQNTLNKK
jgi:two-component system, OmpR family, phosphate regulon response regulator PhoB